jgi:NAD(P)-dependent dehydrogenase (short-subunit alcohol dehydrogenase family)
VQRGTALVTGSSSGFGLRTCVALVARGFRVWASMRSLERAEALRAALRDSGFGNSRVEFVELDVTDADARISLVERILDEDGAVDVLVNNAGHMLTGFAEELDDDALRAQFETNFFGHVSLTQALLGPMRERRHGRVINVSSIAGRSAIPAHSGYCASKFALEGWSEALRYELCPFNVFVCLVEPGLFPTQMFGRNQIEGGSGERSVYARLRAGLDADSSRMRKLLSFADPDAVARVIAEIALAEHPRLRWPVGIDAWVSTLSWPPIVERLWEARMTRIFRS